MTRFVIAAVLAVATSQILPPISPDQCYQNSDCAALSYCQVGNGTGPWACHPFATPVCANATQVCLHNGFTREVGCTTDADCGTGAFVFAFMSNRVTTRHTAGRSVCGCFVSHVFKFFSSPFASGSFCKNTLHRSPPFICEGDDAPICACECVADWTGLFCDVWAGGSGPGAANKTVQ